MYRYRYRYHYIDLRRYTGNYQVATITVYYGVYCTPLGRFSTLDISTVGKVSVSKHVGV